MAFSLKESIAKKRSESNKKFVDIKQQSSQNNTAIEIAKRTESDLQDPDAVILLIDSIDVKKQGRTIFENIEELATSIKKNGQLQSVIVKQISAFRYELISGERRYRAIKDVLKQESIRATIRRVTETDTKKRLIQLSENTERDDYLPLDLAYELADLKEKTGLNNKALGTEIGKSETFVSKFVGLANAPEEVKQAIIEGHLSASTWFNEKNVILEQLNETQNTVEPDQISTKIEKKNPPVTLTRTPTVSLAMDNAKDMALILQKLAAINNLALIDVDLTGKVTKKQLQAIIGTRAKEILDVL